jgi:hypothetical protein
MPDILDRIAGGACTAEWANTLPPQVKNYFNTTGFERWRKIYGETDEVG